MKDHILNNTAVILFSRSSKEEADVKNFLPAKLHSRNKEIVQKFIDRSIQQIKAADLPFFIWNEQMQQGSTFGEKLADAIESVFQKGFQKVIVIGNDCISLTSHEIRSAAISLQNHDAVLAPTCKGGVYLLGLSKNSFNKKNFIDIRWQTASTCQDLLTFMAPQQVCKMALKNDINEYADLLQQLHLLLKNNPVRLFVENLLSLSHIKFSRNFTVIDHCQPHYSFGSKAPPSFFA